MELSTKRISHVGRKLHQAKHSVAWTKRYGALSPKTFSSPFHCIYVRRHMTWLHRWWAKLCSPCFSWIGELYTVHRPRTRACFRVSEQVLQLGDSSITMYGLQNPRVEEYDNKCSCISDLRGKNPRLTKISDVFRSHLDQLSASCYCNCLFHIQVGNVLALNVLQWDILIIASISVNTLSHPHKMCHFGPKRILQSDTVSDPTPFLEIYNKKSDATFCMGLVCARAKTSALESSAEKGI